MKRNCMRTSFKCIRNPIGETARRITLGGGTSQVDWDVVKRTNKLLPSARQHWLVKQVARVNATGQNMAGRKERTSDKCPRCKELTEDNTHVLLCQHSTAQKVWDTQLELLQEVMDRHDTAFSVSGRTLQMRCAARSPSVAPWRPTFFWTSCGNELIVVVLHDLKLELERCDGNVPDVLGKERKSK